MNPCKFPLVLLTFCASFSLSARSNPFLYPMRTVFVDAGHGGRDSGAARSYGWGDVTEKEIVLDVAGRVATKLQARHSDWNIVMTRNDDTFVSLSERCQIAYTTPLSPKSSALFLSIHVNSAPSPSASGYEVLVRDSTRETVMLSSQTPKQNIPLFAAYTDGELNQLLDQRSHQIAETVDQVLSTGFVSRGVKVQDVQVLRESRTPSILVELGFLTNEDEARNLMDDAWRERMASSIVLAIEQVARQ
ncbi:MAG: N-acetylmuramoyl-L-alanine amidase [Sphaerochaetaceae bacterium]|nr:N-acetylmuramoyl-L-alanine amidase [Spirochaetales bacterium]MDY5498760.1 N-acetylmuramoyl-L-alanine amidase [Sphaerochaetaceae bacterium]